MTYPLKNWEKAKRGYIFGQKTFYSSRHLGVDHIVPEGTPVYAPFDSEIVFSGTGVQGGNTIWVKFSDELLGWLVMRCMHLSKLMPKGKYKEGDIIGYTGNTGKFTSGPHLHTDISRQKVQINNFKNFIDPEKYFLERAKNKIKI
jgi:murein DD-endopeptidase MepM/ murein hydrolase activator NlpD